MIQNVPNYLKSMRILSLEQAFNKAFDARRISEPKTLDEFLILGAVVFVLDGATYSDMPFNPSKASLPKKEFLEYYRNSVELNPADMSQRRAIAMGDIIHFAESYCARCQKMDEETSANIVVNMIACKELVN
jgi:hypothetical protein